MVGDGADGASVDTAGSGTPTVGAYVIAAKFLCATVVAALDATGSCS